MTEHATPVNEPEAVAVFDEVEKLEAAIDDLRMAGVPRDDISLPGSEESLRERLGERFRRTEDPEDDPDAPRTAHVSRESLGAAEGALIGAPMYVFAVGAAAAVGVLAPAAGIAGAILAATLGGGVGHAAGAALATAVGDEHAEWLQEQIARGGLLPWVRLSKVDEHETVLEILRLNSGRDVHVHEWTVNE